MMTKILTIIQVSLSVLLHVKTITLLFKCIDDVSQVSYLLDHVAGDNELSSKSPGSISDSGIGRSVFDTETKSLVSEFTKV